MTTIKLEAMMAIERLGDIYQINGGFEDPMPKYDFINGAKAMATQTQILADALERQCRCMFMESVNDTCDTCKILINYEKFLRGEL